MVGQSALPLRPGLSARGGLGGLGGLQAAGEGGEQGQREQARSHGFSKVSSHGLIAFL